MYRLNRLLRGKKRFSNCLVRCVDWDCSILYFQVHYYDDINNSYVGVLDDGSQYTVSASHGFWVYYEEGMEYMAKAV